MDIRQLILSPLFLTNVITIVLAATVTILILWYKWIRRTIKIHIMRELGDTYQVIKTKTVNQRNTEWNWKGKKYILDITKSILNKKRSIELWFDESSTIPLSFYKGKTVNPDVLKAIIEDAVFKRIGGGVKDKQLTILIIVLLAALGAVMVFSFYTIGNLNEQILMLATNGETSIVV